ncbi:MAG: DUF4954 family protein [Tannerellaceae bacterium]|jgi:hypothetical protein|nr:DUF4954 family protein [Tannerellaceae bacterium]
MGRSSGLVSGAYKRIKQGEVSGAYRRIKQGEVSRLKEQGCSSADWSRVRVKVGFDTTYVRESHFSGEVYIGVFAKEVEFYGGVKKHTGIYRATVHNCKLGDNVYIGEVRNYIANYVIEEEAVIENVDMLAVEGESSFGNGTLVSVLNESGGQEVPIYDRLSSQLAYILAVYPGRGEAVSRLKAMIGEYVRSVSSSMGLVGRKAQIINCRNLRGVKIGAYARLEGVNSLTNGTIASKAGAPTAFGAGVIAENFIASTNATVTQGAEVFNTFIGQGCTLGKQYSAENCLFFANCQGMHGEACAVFAGPYTVTHHKSTLLIAGYFSFLNAGSGSNQSNHMYKMGPIHQGIVERGSKTASDSYVLWPAKIGAFTLVMGRHYTHSDTSELPFSYLIESGGDSVLVPGVNLRSVGTIRDAQKWPKRDKRTDPDQLDQINYNLLSPYTIARIQQGVEVLRKVQGGGGGEGGGEPEAYRYGKVKIKRSSLERGLKLYEMSIVKYLWQVVVDRLGKEEYATDEAMRARLRPETEVGEGEWLDVSGLIAPKSEVERLLQEVAEGEVKSLGGVAERFAELQGKYDAYAWRWVVEELEKRYGVEVERIRVGEVEGLVAEWKKSVEELEELLYADAAKEMSMVGEEVIKRMEVEGWRSRACGGWAEVRGRE